MKLCKRIERCPQVISLRSREWADDAQFADAIKELCSKCKEKQS